MQQHDEITGVIDRFFFQSIDTGFSVFVLHMKHKKETIVRGHMPHVHVGQQVHLTGEWVMHPKFGQQFNARECTAHIPSSIRGLKKYLSSGLIKGVGPVYAEKMVAAFGQDVLDVIDKNPARLQTVEGLGPKRIETITNAWQEQKEIASIMVFLQEKGVSTTYATKIYKKYGQDAGTIVQENPYRLAEDIWGIGFKTADQIAQSVGFEKESVERLRAGILFTLTCNITNKGNIYSELNAIKEKTFKLLGLESHPTIKQRLTQALHELYSAEKIKLISTVEDTAPIHYLTLATHYYTEKALAKNIRALSDYPRTHTFDLTTIYQYIRDTNKTGIALNEEQQKGILAALEHKITVITGGPGTGKTTLIKTLLSLLEQHNIRYRLTAPTGRAAKRMTEGTGRHALTLHRLLGFDPSIGGFVHNERNTLSLDFLIVDESSMIDLFLAHALFKAVPRTAHILFIGDSDQLPSVGPGAILADLIESKKTASVRLQEIFRQAQDSLIIVNAHRINQGEFPRMHIANARRDFIYIKEDDPHNIPAHLHTIFTQLLPQKNIPSEKAIALTPMNRGGAGTQKINYELQNLLNPKKSDKQIAHAGTQFKLGDRVMQIRNNYDKNVFNGDIGIIHDINLHERSMTVIISRNAIVYDFSELDELVLAYAITIHKSQGSEFSAVIIPLFTQHFTLLQRNLIYTAVTRAKKLCIVIGQTKALAIAIHTNTSVARKTFLQEFLTTELTCR